MTKRTKTAKNVRKLMKIVISTSVVGASVCSSVVGASVGASV